MNWFQEARQIAAQVCKAERIKVSCLQLQRLRSWPSRTLSMRKLQLSSANLSKSEQLSRIGYRTSTENGGSSEYPLTYGRRVVINFTIREEKRMNLFVMPSNYDSGVQGDAPLRLAFTAPQWSRNRSPKVSNREREREKGNELLRLVQLNQIWCRIKAPKAAALEEFDLIPLQSVGKRIRLKLQARYFNDSQSHQSGYDTADSRSSDSEPVIC